MEFSDAIAGRRMVRRFSEIPVAGAVTDSIVDAGRSGPSAGFSQGQRFVVVTRASTRREIAAAADERGYQDRGFEPWLSSAPVHIVLGVDTAAYISRYAKPDKVSSSVATLDGEWLVPWWWVDAGASLMAMLLAATDHGLASGFLGAHACKAVHGIVDFGPDVQLVGVVTIGHPLPDHKSSSVAQGRMPRTEQIRYML